MSLIDYAREHDEMRELRRLSEAATAGEWLVKPQRLEGADPDSVGENNNTIWVDHGQGFYPVVALANVRAAEPEGKWPAMCRIAPDDAALIVAAVNFVRAMLAADRPVSALHPGEKEKTTMTEKTKDKKSDVDTAESGPNSPPPSPPPAPPPPTPPQPGD